MHSVAESVPRSELECSAEESGRSEVELGHSAVVLDHLVAEWDHSVAVWAHSVIPFVSRKKFANSRSLIFSLEISKISETFRTGGNKNIFTFSRSLKSLTKGMVEILLD